MTLDLDPIRARLAAATPGPWFRRQIGTLAPEVASHHTTTWYGSPCTEAVVIHGFHNDNDLDLDLIANAPSDMAALIAEVERLRTELADHTPAPCDMKCREPYDFAWCKTHDSTFPLGEKCKFDGREPWEVYADEADEQRRRAVRAEMQVERLRESVQRVRVLIEDWQTNGNSRELGDPTAYVWHVAASQALRALDGAE